MLNDKQEIANEVSKIFTLLEAAVGTVLIDIEILESELVSEDDNRKNIGRT